MKITLVGVLVVEENLIHKKPSYFQPITDQFQIESWKHVEIGVERSGSAGGGEDEGLILQGWMMEKNTW